MKTFLIHFVFIQLATVASLKTRKAVSITLSAAKDIPVSGFLIDNSKSEWNKEVMDQIKAVSKENSNNISVIKSRLTDINKAVNNLLNQYVHGIVPASDGYIGCYKDDSSRLLKYKISNVGNSLTLAKGRKHCKGYKYTGLQYGTYIFCGNILVNEKYPRVPESNCNMACAGEKNRMCGSADRNSIYLVKP
ncbi:Hypothetical predicted protein [Mytilus galloprovincialis]|uniref:WSC domain-containing protein n=1 Tax=Mytilus galloprovincialis TaxID=29158 RepID=A0A8B6FZ31_MYTGA|nr:Hypothetical predicted protein [Mytilus galloprovincialis]